MKKNYVNPRCSKIVIVEDSNLLINSIIVGNDDNWVNKPEVKPRPNNMWVN